MNIITQSPCPTFSSGSFFLGLQIFHTIQKNKSLCLLGASVDDIFFNIVKDVHIFYENKVETEIKLKLVGHYF